MSCLDFRAVAWELPLSVWPVMGRGSPLGQFLKLEEVLNSGLWPLITATELEEMVDNKQAARGSVTPVWVIQHLISRGRMTTKNSKVPLAANLQTSILYSVI